MKKEFFGAVQEIAAGGNHTLLRQGGKVFAFGTILSWGLNSSGELGQLSIVKAPGGFRSGFVPAPILLLPH